MYLVRLQVNTCNVQRERLALLARDLSSYKGFAPTELVIRSDRDRAEVFPKPAWVTLPG
jgi:hypothetical protein